MFHIFFYDGYKKTDKVKGISISEKFIENIKCILNNQIHIHGSHISGEILAYSHSYWNFKVRENKENNKCYCS